MKQTIFKNRMNGERFICEDTRAVEIIDGVEYLVVHREINQRPVMMRKDMLEKINQNTYSKKVFKNK